MKLKRKIRKFFTLNRRHEEGFTLVELIVVIAIMAILAGVGSVGYSGYIKSANKNNDKVLVGNIMRAIETGVNSTMFISDDSFKLGSISYPVGIVILSANGTEVVNSTTETIPPTEGKCEFATISGIIKVENKTDYICVRNIRAPYIVVTQIPDVTYCATHSASPDIQTLDGTYISKYEHVPGKKDFLGYTFEDCSDGCEKFEEVRSPYPTGAKIVTNLDSLYTASSNGSLCEAAYANQFGTFTGENKIDTAETGDPIYDSLVAAFGDLSGLKLSYDKWNADDGFGYATFYTGATDLMDSLESMAGTLAVFSGNSTLANTLGLSNTYGSTDEILTGVSNNLITSYGSTDALLEAWNDDKNMTWDSYGFNVAGRENYSAMRASYNNAFASYLDANGASTYSDAVRNYSKNVVGIGSISLPLLVCSDAFTDAESGLQDQLGCTNEEFEQIAQLYQEYIDSGACSDNGSLVYDILDTVNSTADVANANKEINGTSVFDYYNSYVNEISAMYSEAQSRAGDGIVIVVTIENGKLNFQVSPAAANPRND